LRKACRSGQRRNAPHGPQHWRWLAPAPKTACQCGRR